MPKVFTILLGLVICSFAIAQSDNPKYDKHLADSLGADAYGMKMYILVIIKTGSTRIDDKKKVDSILRGHLQNIMRLANLGKLVVAGPLFENEKNYEGIFILNVATTEDANALLETDPAIIAGLFNTELYKWYGSAALPEFLQYHQRIQKTQF